MKYWREGTCEPDRNVWWPVKHPDKGCSTFIIGSNECLFWA